MSEWIMRCLGFPKSLKKFVIACHRAHIYKWLNLLPEPKRHLQRFGFVHYREARDMTFLHKRTEVLGGDYDVLWLNHSVI